jgi:hypothetical protein
MIRHLTVFSASCETYSNEPYNNSYLINTLFVDRCGDVRKEYYFERAGQGEHDCSISSVLKSNLS